MTTRVINPWTWQDSSGYAQAVEITQPTSLLVCAGQAAIDAHGGVVGVGDMRTQIATSLDNLVTVLTQAGYSLADVVRLAIFATDVDSLFANYDLVVERLSAAGCRPASSVLGVNRLAYPEMLVEIEATAMR